MKRFAAFVAMICLALVVTPAGLAQGAPAPITNLQVHFLAQNSTLTTPPPNPEHPEWFAPDISMIITFDRPPSAISSTVAVGVMQAPLFYSSPWYSEFTPLAKMIMVPPQAECLTVTMTPVLNWGQSYIWDINAWSVEDATCSVTTAITGALVSSTPQPVFNLAASSGQLSWNNSVPVWWDGYSWVNWGKSGMGGPIGQLVITGTQDGAPWLAATVEGTATNYPLPAMSPGHRYDLSVVRTFEGKTSNAAKAAYMMPVATSTSISGPSSVRHNKWFKLAGKVSPGMTGYVRVQRWRYYHHRWVSSGSTYLKLTNGSWHWSLRVKSRGTWRYRATYVPASGTAYASTSGYKIVKIK